MSTELPANTLPEEVRAGIIEVLNKSTGNNTVLHNFKIIAGGCINHGGTLQTSAGTYFAKWNDARHFPEMFDCEARGLDMLAKSKSIRIPTVFGVGKTENYQLIVLGFIQGAKRAPGFWTDFGHQLATLHQTSSDQFGLDYDNYIGSLRQFNQPTGSWIDFFCEQRISRQLMLAEKSGLTDHSLRKKFDVLFKKLPDLLIDKKPGLIHGDLWSGNLIVDETGAPCLIDPAVYYGNPEIELAYTKLFGGFDEAFFDSYMDILEIEPGFDDRAAIYNLYPLLVHTNLFGKTYVAQIDAILDKFI